MAYEEYAVVMENISKTFPGVKALNRVSFKIKKGEIHGLVGENGAGKSTLIKILMGVYSKDRDSGDIYINNQKVEIDNPIKAEKMGLSAVYQHMMLAKQLSVAENIFLGQQPLKNGMVDWKYMNDRAKDILQDLHLETISPTTRVMDLTTVQQEMIAIAKALSRNANILIFDEPTALLADEETKELLTTMKRLKEQGLSIIYISHRLDEVFEVCDRVTVLRDGNYITTKPVSELTEDSLITMMVGREIKDLYYKEEIEIGQEILRVKNLTREPVIKDVSFTLHEGEILGIFGLVGSGRTELVRALFGADRIDQGEIEIMGKKVNIKAPSDAILNGIGLIPEERQTQGLALPLSVKENSALVSCKYSEEYRSNYGILNRNKEKELAEKSISELDIKTPSIEQKVKYLSGGNQQKVVVAKWLNVDSKILLFDEPTVGIDVGAKTEIYKLMARLLQERKGIIFISSYLPELLGICDRIVVISEGRITGIVERSEATQEKLLQLATNIHRKKKGGIA